MFSQFNISAGDGIFRAVNEKLVFSHLKLNLQKKLMDLVTAI